MCDAVFDEAKVPESGYMIQVSPTLHSNIAAALIASANLRKLVEPSQRRKSESTSAHSFRQRRAKALSAILRGLVLDELCNTKVRNSLDHFDEYLDDENSRLARGSAPSAPMAAYNMTFSHWQATDPKVYPIRLYVSSERKFYNMKHSIDLQKLREQAASIADRIMARPEFSNATEPGGLMIRLA